MYVTQVFSFAATDSAGRPRDVIPVIDVTGSAAPVGRTAIPVDVVGGYLAGFRDVTPVCVVTNPAVTVNGEPREVLYVRVVSGAFSGGGGDTTPYLAQGAAAFGVWTHDTTLSSRGDPVSNTTWPITVDNADRGNIGDPGYGERAIASWVNDMFEDVDPATGDYYIGVTAWGNNHTPGRTGDDGIDYVDFQWANGTVTRVPDRTTPGGRRSAYWVRIKAADAAASGPQEIRAKTVPLVGRPYVLQGDPKPTDGWSTLGPGGSTYQHNAYRGCRWSMFVYVNKGDQNRHTRYVDTVNGSDSNTGLTSASPWLTYKKYFDDYKVNVSTTDFSRADIVHVACATAKMPGFEATDTDYIGNVDGTVMALELPASYRWLRVRRDPAATQAQVVFTQQPTHPLRAQYLSLEGVTLKTPFYHRALGKGASRNAGNTRLTDFLMDGGSTTDANGYPTSNVFVEWGSATAKAHGIVSNGRVYWSFWCGFHQMTHLSNLIIEETNGDGGDPVNDCKTALNLRFIRNRDPAGGNHGDCIQIKGNGAGLGRTQHLLEDISVTAADGNDQQNIIVDEGCPLTDVAFIRCIMTSVNSGGLSNFLFSGSGSRNVLVYDPQFLSSQNWDLPVAIGISSNVRFVMQDTALCLGEWDQRPRYGACFVTPWHLGDTMIADSSRAVPTWGAILGTDLKECLDAEDPAALLLTKRNAAGTVLDPTPRVYRFRNTALPEDGGYWMTENGTTLFHEKRPFFNPTGFNGRPSVDFDGANAAGTAGGDDMYFTNTLSAAYGLTGTEAAFEVWGALVNNPADNLGGVLWAIGNGTGINGTIQLQLTYDGALGGRKFVLSATEEDTAGGTGRVQKTLTDTVAIPTGALVFYRVQTGPAGFSLTFWTAAYPGGRTMTTTWSTGKKQYVVTTSRHVIGANSIANQGNANTFCGHRFNVRLLTLPLTTTKADALVAALRVRSGIAAP